MADLTPILAAMHWDPQEVLQLSPWSCAATTKEGRPCQGALDAARAPKILVALSTLVRDRPATPAAAAAETHVLWVMASRCVCAEHHGAVLAVMALWAERLEEARRFADFAAYTLTRV